MRSARVAIGVLGLVTVVNCGACYYAFGALIHPIAEDTGWPGAALGATFGAVLLLTGTLGIMAGRLLDRRGARLVFALAGTLGAGLLLEVSGSHRLLMLPTCVALLAAAGILLRTPRVARRGQPASSSAQLSASRGRASEDSSWSRKSRAASSASGSAE
jgi:MFS family permease